MKKVFFAALLGTVLFSCKKNDDPKTNDFHGPKVSLHHGKAWSTLTLARDGKPERLTVTIDNDLMNSVLTADNGTGGGHTHEHSVVVPLHPKALESTPFKFVNLDWNPTGHPDPIYNIKHFDYHFYMTTQAEVEGYLDMTKITAPPAPEYLPTNHAAGAPVPKMGSHWVDLASPEFSGTPFTQTFIYGSYDSKVVFYEPMITHDFLKNATNFERPIPQPTKWQKTGYYPTKMRVQKAGTDIQVSLEGFVYRQAS